MNRRQNNWLIVIVILFGLALWIDLSKTINIKNPFNDKVLVFRNTETRLGLDLRGGLQVLMEADVPANVAVNPEDLKVARQILENRSNALGVSEVVMQTAGDRRIVAEFPGISNPEEVVASLQKTGLLEFVDMGTNRIPEGTIIKTDYTQQLGSQAAGTSTAPTPTEAPTATPTVTATPEAGASPTPAAGGTPAPDETVYHTVMTGTSLSAVSVQVSQMGQYEISFTLKTDAADMFSQYTGSHVGQILGIVLDKRVISAPSINSQISGGQGVIQGSFTQQTANELAIQLRYGSLPIPLKVVESRTVGPTLGEESVRKSILAGAIGLSVVILFMALYYRLPGVLADLALVVYALLSLAVFKLVPVVLTLPGIAGFILSIGMAVDANVLIFERLKEELRAGKNLRMAIDLGWARAWPSIRDSNFSTLITCVILFWFGSAFGASLVKGFALTLGFGVVVSLFTAIIVTRTFLHVVLDNVKFGEHHKWFGV
jgi:preprotein translocase subunit SecD